MFTRGHNKLTSWDRSQTQVHPGSLTQYYVVRGVKGGALSSLPVADLRGATAKGIGPHCSLSFCLWGKVQQVSASVLSGKDFMLGAALKHTVGKVEASWAMDKDKEQWGKSGKMKKEKRAVQNSTGSVGRMSCGPHPVHRRVLARRSELWSGLYNQTHAGTLAKAHSLFKQHYYSGWYFHFKGFGWGEHVWHSKGERWHTTRRCKHR